MAPRITVKPKKQLPRISGAYDLWISGAYCPRPKGSLFIPQTRWRLVSLGIAPSLEQAIGLAIGCLPLDENGLSQWEYIADGVFRWEAQQRYARITTRILD